LINDISLILVNVAKKNLRLAEKLFLSYFIA